MVYHGRYTGKNRLLSALPAEDFAQFFSELKPVDLLIRQVVQDAAQAAEYAFFLESGVTSILSVMADGSAIEVGVNSGVKCNGIMRSGFGHLFQVRRGWPGTVS